jgi:hypothetical protein
MRKLNVFIVLITNDPQWMAIAAVMSINAFLVFLCMCLLGLIAIFPVVFGFSLGLLSSAVFDMCDAIDEMTPKDK